MNEVKRARWVPGLGEALLVAVVAVLVADMAFLDQSPIAVSDGHGWDGEQYFRMAEAAAGRDAPTPEAPFAYRVLVPFLAGRLFPGDLLLGFRVLDVLAVAATVVLMVLWLRRHLGDAVVRVVVLVLFLVHWTGPVRSLFWYPVLVDYALLPLLVAGLLLVERLRDGAGGRATLPALCLVTGAAVAVREAGLLVGLAALFAGNPLPTPLRSARLRHLRGIAPRSALPLACGLLVLLAVHLTVAADSSHYSFAGSVEHWITTTAPTTWLLAWFIGFGPVLAVVLVTGRAAGRFLRAHQGVAVYLLAVAALSWVGGSDIERFLVWAAPAVYVLVGLGLQRLPRDRITVAALVVLAAAQMIGARLLWSVPAAPVPAGMPGETVVLTPLGNAVSVFDLTAADQAPGARLAAGLGYVTVVGAFLAVVALRRRTLTAARSSPRPPPAERG